MNSAKLNKSLYSLQEFERITRVLDSIANRPSMYGYPEHAELLAKHLTHICFLILLQNWSFRLTEILWEGLAYQLYNRKSFVKAVVEDLAYRIKKWGSSEDEALDIVIQVFHDLWREFEPSISKSNPVNFWFRELLTHRYALGSPNAADTVLLSLLTISLKEGNDLDALKNSYWTKCNEIQGTGNKGLKNIKAKKTNDQYLVDYSDFVTGIKSLLPHIKNLVDDDFQSMNQTN